MAVQTITTCVANHAKALANEVQPLVEQEEWPAIFERAQAAATSICAQEPRAVEEVRQLFCQGQALHFAGVFDAIGLPETPTDWHPVPVCAATTTAHLALIMLNQLLEMETVSYGSENSGKLFVNLVALPGQGALAEKSAGGMRGHTDAVSFPFPGALDPTDDRIGPSPDAVCLIGLRNDQKVPTTYIPVDEVLAKLSTEDVETLKAGDFFINAQHTFQLGTTEILGFEHHVDGGKILQESDQGMWIRYSHSHVATSDDSQQTLQQAQKNFEAACKECHQHLVLQAGDVAIINNRKALHGRSKVGEEPGGQSRWILRSYGLNTSKLLPPQIQHRVGHRLFP